MNMVLFSFLIIETCHDFTFKFGCYVNLDIYPETCIRVLIGIRICHRNLMMFFEEFEEEFQFHNKCSTLKGATLNETLYYASNHPSVRVTLIMQPF